jgi:hypothetical protein
MTASAESFSALFVKTAKRDGAELKYGNFLLSNNTWGKQDIRRYEQIIGINAEKRRFGWKWDWPMTNRVVSYPEIIVGKKPWNAASTYAALPCPVDRCDLDVSLSVDQKIASGGYNLSFDIWLTKDRAAEPSGITHEIMIWLDFETLRPLGRKIDTFTVDGLRYDLYVAKEVGESKWDYLCFVNAAKAKVTNVGIGGFIKILLAEGLIDRNAFVASVEFGNEIMGGKGETVISDFAVRFSEASLVGD